MKMSKSAILPSNHIKLVSWFVVFQLNFVFEMSKNAFNSLNELHELALNLTSVSIAVGSKHGDLAEKLDEFHESLTDQVQRDSLAGLAEMLLSTMELV